MTIMKLKQTLLFLCALISLLILTSCISEKSELQPEKITIPESAVESETVIKEIVEETEEAEETEQHVEEPQLVKKELIIDMLRTAFSNENIVISQDTIISWKNSDDRVHQVACYVDKERIFKSQQLKPGDTDSYRFIQPGDYRCIDVVFGYWSYISVSADNNKITGNFILSGGYSPNLINSAKVGIAASIIALFILLGVQFLKKRQNNK